MVLFKAVGALAYLLLFPIVPQILGFFVADLGGQVAAAHTLYNVLILVVCLPLLRPVAHGLATLINDSTVASDPSRARYLDDEVLDTPALAIGQGMREALRMADLVREMYAESLQVFQRNDLELACRLQRQDDVIDRLEEQIKRYLTQVAESQLTVEQSQREVSLLFFIQDLENIGDIVDRNLMELAKKKITTNLAFSDAGARDIEYLYRLVGENLNLVITAYASNSRELAEKVIRHRTSIAQIERDLRQSHIDRLHNGVRESFETSAIHLDVLSSLTRINSHATNIAFVVLGEV